MKPKVIKLAHGVALEMVPIPGGSFMMGSPEDELDRFEDEGPRYPVTVAKFWMGKYPVTQAQYQTIMGDNPSYFKGANRPVEQMDWHDAMEFCARLSAHTGQPYTLPSEAQWEYACRANTNTPFHFGETITTDQANYNGKTTDVGSFPSNDFGLYDMHGNVWEWCLDHWHSNYSGAPADGSAWVDAEAEENKFRIIRGGSWFSYPRFCRSACRVTFNPVFSSYFIGFRVVSMHL